MSAVLNVLKKIGKVLLILGKVCALIFLIYVIYTWRKVF